MRALDEAATPRLSRGIRLRQDAVRGRTVLLAPERVLDPSSTALEILWRCNGRRSVAAIVDELQALYTVDRDRIAADVWTLLCSLATKRIVEL